MKQQKEKKEKESFWNALIIYGFIAIALIGFLGYMYGSIAIGTMFIIAPLLFKGAGTPPKDGMFTKSPANKVKDVWQGADKKKKAGIVIGIITLLPFFILGIIWMAMMGAMFAVDLLFILPIILIILWFWFRTPSHQTFAGSASLGHPAVLAVAVIMLLLIGVVAGMNYMQLHKYDGLKAGDVIKPDVTAYQLSKQDTNNNGIPDYKDPDVDGDGIPNQWDIDANGNGIIDEHGVILYENAKKGMYNQTITNLILDQYNALYPKNSTKKEYGIDPTPTIEERDINATYNLKVYVTDMYEDTFYPSTSYVSKTSWDSNWINNTASAMSSMISSLYANKTTSGTLNISDPNSTYNAYNTSIHNGASFGNVYRLLPLAGSHYRGHYIAGAMVELIAEPTEEKFKDSQGNGIAPTPVGERGYAYFRGLPAGKYTITVNSAGYMSYQQTDFVLCNKTQETLIPLTPIYIKAKVTFTANSVRSSVGGGSTAEGSIVAKLTIKPETMDDSDIARLQQQQSMFGWSGLPMALGTNEIWSSKHMQIMFNEIAGGLQDIIPIGKQSGGQGTLNIDKNSVSGYVSHVELGIRATYYSGGISGGDLMHEQGILIHGSDSSDTNLGSPNLTALAIKDIYHSYGIQTDANGHPIPPAKYDLLGQKKYYEAQSAVTNKLTIEVYKLMEQAKLGHVEIHHLSATYLIWPTQLEPVQTQKVKLYEIGLHATAKLTIHHYIRQTGWWGWYTSVDKPYDTEQDVTAETSVQIGATPFAQFETGGTG